MTSGSVAGAEMITFFAPASRCFFASSRLVKRPVDSITTSTPMSPQGRSAGIALLEDLDLLAVDGDGTAALDDLAREPAEDRVVLQEVGERRVVGDVVDRDDVELRVGLMRRTEEVAPDAPEAVDADLDWSHVLSIPPGWFLWVSVSADRDLDPVAVRVEQVGGVVGRTVFGPLPRLAVVGAAGRDPGFPCALHARDAR